MIQTISRRLVFILLLAFLPLIHNPSSKPFTIIPCQRGTKRSCRPISTPRTSSLACRRWCKTVCTSAMSIFAANSSVRLMKQKHLQSRDILNPMFSRAQSNFDRKDFDFRDYNLLIRFLLFILHSQAISSRWAVRACFMALRIACSANWPPLSRRFVWISMVSFSHYLLNFFASLFSTLNWITLLENS